MALKRNSKFQIPNSKPDLVRSLKEMGTVLYDQKWLKSAKDFPIYYVWRGVKPRRSPFGTLRGKKKGEIRYDITIIPPRMLGQEFPKTKGHKHLNNFQELITVLEGRAYYLAQWGKENKIKRVEVIKAKKGDWIIYSPDCDHLTINSTEKRLVMANWLSKKCKSDYSLFEKFQGACYFYTKSGWVKNKNYKKVPKLRFKKPLKRQPKNLDFLYGN